jgi:ATP adenylyltransferase
VEYFFNFDKLAYVTGKRPAGCILCQVQNENPDMPVASADPPDTLIYKSGHSAVALNLYPYNPGHLLLFPLRHVADIRELSAGERRDMDGLLDKALSALDSLYRPSGYNIGYNMGPDAGASIGHLHMHIIPRYAREIGIAELLAGKRVLVEDIETTKRRLRKVFTVDEPAENH